MYSIKHHTAYKVYTLSVHTVYGASFWHRLSAVDWSINSYLCVCVKNVCVCGRESGYMCVCVWGCVCVCVCVVRVYHLVHTGEWSVILVLCIALHCVVRTAKIKLREYVSNNLINSYSHFFRYIYAHKDARCSVHTSVNTVLFFLYAWEFQFFIKFYSSNIVIFYNDK